MKEFENKIETLEYYIKLLLQMTEKAKYPFYHLVIQNGLTKKEVEQILQMCEELSQEHREQKAQGLLYFTDLLTLFAGQLNPKLDVNETIEAMYEQGLFKEMMKDFKHLISRL